MLNKNAAGILDTAHLIDMGAVEKGMPNENKAACAKMIGIMADNDIAKISFIGEGEGGVIAVEELDCTNKQGLKVYLPIPIMDDLMGAAKELSRMRDWYDDWGGKAHLTAQIHDEGFFAKGLILDRNWQAFSESKINYDLAEIAGAKKSFENLLSGIPSDISSQLKNHIENSSEKTIAFDKVFTDPDESSGFSEFSISISGNDELKEILESVLNEMDSNGGDRFNFYSDKKFKGKEVFDLSLDTQGGFAASYSDQSSACYFDDCIEDLGGSLNFISLDDPELVALLEALNKAPASNEPEM